MQRNAQAREPPPRHPGADWVTKTSTTPNHASGRTADLGPHKRSTYPGADQVTKTRTILSPGNTRTDHLLRQRLLYPGADRVIKAMEIITAHGTQTMEIRQTMDTRHRQSLHHPGANRVTKTMETIMAHGTRTTEVHGTIHLRHPRVDQITKAMEITMAHGTRTMEQHGTTYPRHPQAIGLIHRPPHQLYPREHWVIKAVPQDNSGKRTLIHGTTSSHGTTRTLLRTWTPQRNLWSLSTSTSSQKKSGYHLTS